MAGAFFDDQSAASAIKAEIVNKYFWAWAKIMVARNNAPHIAYVDLFAGPGRYNSGESSTPLLVLETALDDPDMRKRLHTIFNDQNPAHVGKLRECIESMPNINQLTHAPTFYNLEISEDITRWFEDTRHPPSLVFFDPWGYKGLSLGLLDSAIRAWGSDLIFFFNYNRINMGIRNEVVEDHIDALFGAERAEILRRQVAGLSPQRREHCVVNAVGEALLGRRANYVLPFGFRTPDGERTSHYLFFVSKNHLGYKIMKEIMYKASAKTEDGVASFEYTPVEDRQLGLLFAYSRKIDLLRRRLLDNYAGMTRTVQALFDTDNRGTPYVEKNYKDILIEMEAANEITCAPPAHERRKNKGKPTMAAEVRVTFPPLRSPR